MITSRNYIKLDKKVNSITSIPPRAKILRRIDKNNISYESNYGIDWGE